MFYDPKWQREPQTKEPTLAGFIAWLEQQDPTAKYDYFDCKRCAIGQYLTSIGTTHHEQDRVNWRLMCDWNAHIAAAIDPADENFGAALERARKFAAA